MPIQSITIYCSSSSDIAPHFHDAGAQLGRAIASHKWTLVYGGNSLGLMKTVANSARDAGAKVVGITPQLFVDEGCCDDRCNELIVTANLRERKHLLEQRGDALVALPGGIGTFEEFFEILAGKSVGYHAKPVAVLNIAGYFNPMLAMIESGIQHRFVRPKIRNLFHIAPDVPDLLRYLTESSAEKSVGG
jgi:uncharacterized protein (TIGR00730 family)